MLFEYVGYSKDSSIIHKSIVEAIPDIFVMLHNQNSCLAQKVCGLESSTACKDGCLRNAENNMHYTTNGLQSIKKNSELLYRLRCHGGLYNSKSYQANYHSCSQFMSGILWDLAKELGFDSLARLLYKSLQFFPHQNLDYTKVQIALLRTDNKFFQSRYQEKIREKFINRGLSPVELDKF